MVPHQTSHLHSTVRAPLCEMIHSESLLKFWTGRLFKFGSYFTYIIGNGIKDILECLTHYPQPFLKLIIGHCVNHSPTKDGFFLRPFIMDCPSSMLLDAYIQNGRL